jgi:hypothetical protein
LQSGNRQGFGRGSLSAHERTAPSQSLNNESLKIAFGGLLAMAAALGYLAERTGSSLRTASLFAAAALVIAAAIAVWSEAATRRRADPPK